MQGRDQIRTRCHADGSEDVVPVRKDGGDGWMDVSLDSHWLRVRRGEGDLSGDLNCLVCRCDGKAAKAKIKRPGVEGKSRRASMR